MGLWGAPRPLDGPQALPSASRGRWGTSGPVQGEELGSPGRSQGHPEGPPQEGERRGECRERPQDGGEEGGGLPSLLTASVPLLPSEGAGGGSRAALSSPGPTATSRWLQASGGPASGTCAACGVGGDTGSQDSRFSSGGLAGLCSGARAAGGEGGSWGPISRDAHSRATSTSRWNRAPPGGSCCCCCCCPPMGARSEPGEGADS